MLFVLFFPFFSKSEPVQHVFPLAVNGDSMEPIFKSGDFVNYSDNTPPKVGDIVYFSCNNDYCLETKKLNGGFSLSFIKRITSMHDDCYYLLGDNPSDSFDSRYFGELCGDQIAIHGVVTGQ